MARHLLLACVATVVVAAPASGQNLLVNGGFDHDLTSWEFLFGDTGATKAWSAVDAHGDPGSGSAVVTFAGAGEDDFASLLQCVPVIGGQVYNLAAEILIPAGQSRSGRASVGSTWWALPDCKGVAIDAPDHFTPTDVVGRWRSVGSSVRAPAGAASALIRLVVAKSDAGGSLRAHFDNVELTVSECAGGVDGWLTSPAFPGFRFRVAVTTGGAPAFFGSKVADCIPGALCVSGALPDRTEILLRLIGPRPNGYLWLQGVRFTPSRLDVEVEQTARGLCKAYRLDSIGPDSDVLDGIVDRTAFLP